MSKWYDSKSLKMKFVFLIAGKELNAWKSRHVRIGGKMMESYTTNRIVKQTIKYLDDEQIWKSDRQRKIMLDLIKGEQK